MKTKLAFVLGAVATIALTPITASAHDNGYYHKHQNNDNRLIGTAIGAIAGGVLGSNLAGGGVQDEGTALGAVLGGAAGYAIAGGSNGGRYYNSGHYNNGGYYNRGYSQPSYGHSYYSQPRYYNTSPTYYDSPPGYYRTGGHHYGGSNYYSRPRVSISFGSGGSYYRPRHYNNYYNSHYRPRHHTRHRHTRHCRH